MPQPDPLDLIRRQIVDLQERVTTLENTPSSQRADGALEGLLTAGLKAITSTVRTAAEAKAARTTEPDDTPTVPTRPTVRDAVQRAAASVARAQAAAAPLFPIAEPEPAAPFAGRTAPRRTYPEAPVRLWNRDHTDHLDVVGRAHGTSTGVGGTRAHVAIRPHQAETACAWLDSLTEPDDGGPAYVVWMDREWTLAGYSTGTWAGLVLDLLPIPKPPRVDQLLGRLNAGQTLAEASRPKTTPPAGAPYAGPFPDLQAGDKIGVEHPDGTITTHEFSGDPEHPVAGDPAAVTSGLKCSKCNRAKLIGHDDGQIADHAYNCPQPAPEPDAVECCERGDEGFHAPDCPVTRAALGRPAPDVDEVLPMPGSPNDKLAQAVTPTKIVFSSAGSLKNHTADAHDATVDGNRLAVEIRDEWVAHWLMNGGVPTSAISANWDGRTWTLDHLRLAGRGVVRAKLTLLPAYGDLYARLDHIHDATAEEDQ